MTTYNSSAAPRLNAVPQRDLPPRPNRHAAPAQPYLVPRHKPNSAQRRAEVKASRSRAVKIMLIAVCMLGMLSMLIFQRAHLIKLNSDRAALEQKLQEVRSDAVRLEAQFNNRVSVESVEEYAKKELGMVKRQKYQVHFFTNDNKDEIILLDQEQK